MQFAAHGIGSGPVCSTVLLADQRLPYLRPIYGLSATYLWPTRISHSGCAETSPSNILVQTCSAAATGYVFREETTVEEGAQALRSSQVVAPTA